MRRNRASVIRREIERAATQAVAGTAAQGAPPGSLGGMAIAGESDGTTGEWKGYGQLNITPLSDFLLARD